MFIVLAAKFFANSDGDILSAVWECPARSGTGPSAAQSRPAGCVRWQRVRDSNPCTGLERALIYFYKYPITSKFCSRLFCVAAFVAQSILQEKAESK